MPQSQSPVVPAWDTTDAAALLELDPVGPDHFATRVSDRLANNHLFGGQVLAQAIQAAGLTVAGRAIHSAHGYFLSPGDGSRQVEFTVERLRDGRQMSARRVVALQDGRALFSMISSWQAAAPEGPSHQPPMPDVPPPESLTSLHALVTDSSSGFGPIPWARVPMFGGIEMRPCRTLTDTVDAELPTLSYWMRMPGAAGILDPLLNAALIAYLSDYWIAGSTAGVRQAVATGTYPFIASIDHALWYYGAAPVDDWLLYHVDSPVSGQQRGLARGLLYDRSGRLIIASAQEIVMR